MKEKQNFKKEHELGKKRVYETKNSRKGCKYTLKAVNTRRIMEK